MCHGIRNREGYRLLGEHVMVRRGSQADRQFVLPRGKSDHNDGLSVLAEVGPVPGQVINTYMQMPHSGRDISSARSQNREDADVFDLVRDHKSAARQRFSNRLFKRQFWSRLVLLRDQG